MALCRRSCSSGQIQSAFPFLFEGIFKSPASERFVASGDPVRSTKLRYRAWCPAFASRKSGCRWSHWSETRADAIARCHVDRYTEDGDIGAVEPIPIGACWLASERCQTDEGHVYPVRCCGWCYRLSLQCPSTDRGDSPAAGW